MPFLPGDAFLALQRGLPNATFVDATPVLDELRAVKTPAEVAHLRTVYNRVAEAIQAAFAAGKPGMTTAEIARQVEREMAQRDVAFLFAFTCAGPGTLRVPSSTRWEPGRILHIDAGGEVGDYLADICRMGCLENHRPLPGICTPPASRSRDERDGSCGRVFRAGSSCVKANSPCASTGLGNSGGSLRMASAWCPTSSPLSRRPNRGRWRRA